MNTPFSSTTRKAQFFIITTVLISGALLVITNMFMSTADLDYTDVLSRHDTDLVENTANQVQEAWWNTSWLHRTPVTIKEMGGEYVTNHSVPFTLPIPPEKVAGDCADIRVVDDGTRLPWVSTTACPVETYDGESTAVARYKMDEADGQYANDSTGNSRHGILGGSDTSQSSDPAWAAGRYGSGLVFDGNDDYVVVSDDPALRGGASATLTVGTWFYTSGVSGEGPLVSKQWDSSNGDWGLHLQDSCPSYDGACVGSPPYVGYYSEAQDRGGEDDYALLYGPVTLNTWNHAMFVLDQPNQTVSLYLNGKLVLEDTNTGEISASRDGNVYIGARYYQNSNPQYFFNGGLDDVRIYDEILSPGQIDGIYRNGIGLNVSVNLTPQETRTLQVYHGNLFAKPAGYVPGQIDEKNIREEPETLSIGPTRAKHEVLQNIDRSVDHLNQRITPDIDFVREDAREDCRHITFRSSLSQLRKNLC